MSELDALLQAARDEPDEDLHRLVLADWLAENGDPDHGEFIRLQIRDAHFPTVVMSKRASQLFDAHSTTWVNDRWGRCQNWTLERGLLSISTGTREDYDGEFERLFSAIRSGWVQSLELRPPPDSYWPNLDWFGSREWLDRDYLSRIGRLILSDGWTQLPALRAAKRLLHLPHLRSLRSFEYRGRGYDREFGPLLLELVTSPHLSGLKVLAIQGSYLNPGVVALLAEWQLEGLTSLRLPGTRFNGDCLRTLLSSPLASQLAALDLRDASLGAEEARALADAPTFSGLRELCLASNRIGDRGLEALLGAPRPPRLGVLDLGDCGLTDSGVRALAGWPGLASVHTLRLGEQEHDLGDDAVRALANSPYLHGMRKLHVRGPEITGAGVRALVESPIAAALGTLVLGGKRIYDSAADHLSSSPNLRGLEFLDVRDTGFGPNGALKLATSTGLAGLRYLLARYHKVAQPDDFIGDVVRIGSGEPRHYNVFQPGDDVEPLRQIADSRRRLDSLLEALVIDSSEERVRAAHELGGLFDAAEGDRHHELVSEVWEVLLRRLDKDPDPTVRAAAAEVLTGLLLVLTDAALEERAEGLDAFVGELEAGVTGLTEARDLGMWKEDLSIAFRKHCFFEPPSASRDRDLGYVLGPVWRALFDSVSEVRASACRLFDGILRFAVRDTSGGECPWPEECLSLALGLPHADVRVWAAETLCGALASRPNPEIPDCYEMLLRLHGEDDFAVRAVILTWLRTRGADDYVHWSSSDSDERRNFFLDYMQASPHADVRAGYFDMHRWYDRGTLARMCGGLLDADDGVRTAALRAFDNYPGWKDFYRPVALSPLRAVLAAARASDQATVARLLLETFGIDGPDSDPAYERSPGDASDSDDDTMGDTDDN